MKLRIFAAGISMILLCHANAQNQSKGNAVLELKVDSNGSITVTPLNNKKTGKTYNLKTPSKAFITSESLSVKDATSLNYYKRVNSGPTETDKKKKSIKKEFAFSADKTFRRDLFSQYSKNTSATYTSERVARVTSVADLIKPGTDHSVMTLHSDEIFACDKNAVYLDILKKQTIDTNPPNGKGIPNYYIYTGTGSNNYYDFNSSTNELTVSVSVENNGTAAAPIGTSVYVGFYLSTDTYIQTSDIFIASSGFSFLAVGYHVNVEISKDLDFLDIPSGTYYIGVICDYTNNVAESNENDNTGYFTPAISYVRPAKANLFLYTDSGSYNAYTYNSGDHTLSVNLSIGNGGETSSGNFRTGIYLSHDILFDDFDDYLIGTSQIENLNTGYYTNVEINFDLDDFFIPAGTYYIIMYIDDTFQVPESDETDNLYYFTDSFTYSPPLYPNLYIYDGEGSNTSYDFDEETNVLNVFASVGNNGNFNSSAFRVGFYVINSDTSSQTNPLIGSVNIENLDYNDFQNISVESDLDDFDLDEGTYVIFVWLDDLGQIEESDETDNIIYFNTPITYYKPGQPNLFVYTGTGSENSYSYDNGSKNLVVNICIANSGTAAAGSFRVGFYLSDDETITTSDTFIGSKDISELDYGYYNNISLETDLSEIEPEIYYVSVIIDDTYLVTESDETDNNGYFTDALTIASDQAPNLMIYTGTGSNNDYDYNSSTNDLDVYASIGNDGNSVASNFRVGFYLSANTSIETTDNLMKSYTINSLDPGYYQNLNISVNLNDLSLSEGNYYVGFWADDLMQLSEIDETDNAGYFAEPISYTEESEEINITMYTGSGANNSYNYYASSKELEIHASIANSGNIAASNFRIGFYLSTDISIEIADRFLKGVYVPTLAPGSYANVDINVNMNDYAPLNGNFYVGFWADDLLTIEETSETDNSYHYPAPLSLTITSISDNIQLSDYIVYPNPTTDVIFVKQNKNSVQGSTITIYDTYAKVIEVMQMDGSDGKNVKEIDFSNYKNGLYFIQITDSENVFIQKMVKK